jgi:hypothetical protein
MHVVAAVGEHMVQELLQQQVHLVQVMAVVRIMLVARVL